MITSITRIAALASKCRPVATLAAAVALSLALALVLGRPPPHALASGPASPGPRLYDHGAIGSPVGAPDATEAQQLRFFTDCAPGDFGGCGGPPGHWALGSIPVTFCTMEANRPPSISAQDYRDAVSAAARMWNGTDVGVGVSYTGDCATGTTWRANDNRNEIAFDDARHVITGTTAGVARGSWTNIPSVGVLQDRVFNEFDIVLDSRMDVPDRCFRSIVAHEMGHALGLGHSDDPTDLMYPSFDPADPQSCRQTASAADRSRLAELYGVNLPPSVSVSGPQSAYAGTTVSLRATASDPEGDPITFQWAELSGPTVTLTADGATAQFTAPDETGGALRIQVTAFDRYLHAATSDLTVSVDAATAAPATAPTLASFLSVGGSGVLTWGPVPNASDYRFCAGGDCATVASPQVPVDWEVVLGAAGSPGERRILTTGARPTTLAACNSIGCSPASAGPLAGGVRWPAWGIGFDYLAWAYDVPRAGIRYTVGSVVNTAGEARRFTIYTGSATDPRAVVVKACGSVAPGGACVGLLLPGQAGHGSVVTIVSEREGTPTIEQRVTIR